MPHAIVEDLLAERARCLNTIDVLKDTAAKSGTDPSETELEAMEKASTRIKKIDEMLPVLGDQHDLDEDLIEKLRKPTPSAPDGGPKYRTAGEMVYDCVHARWGPQTQVENQEASRRWERVMKRAAQHMGTTAEDTTPVAGGLGGLFVAPIVGPVINMAPQGQPFLSAIGRRPAPNALNFMRPRLVDPDFETGVGPQGLQKAELVSKKFDILTDGITLKTVGGYLNVSQQLMSLGPEGWNIIIAQLQARLAWAGEAAAVAEADQTGAVVDLAAGASAAQVLAALYDAAALVYENTKALPTWMAYGPAGWKMLGSLVDLANRPLFPFLGAANAMGSASLGDFELGPLGLQQVVTPGIKDTTIYMGNSYGIESYVYPFPILEAVEPSQLGQQVAVAEALAFYRPTTKEAVTGDDPEPAEQNGVVKIALAA